MSVTTMVIKHKDWCLGLNFSLNINHLKLEVMLAVDGMMVG